MTEPATDMCGSEQDLNSLATIAKKAPNTRRLKGWSVRELAARSRASKVPCVRTGDCVVTGSGGSAKELPVEDPSQARRASHLVSGPRGNPLISVSAEEVGVPQN